MHRVLLRSVAAIALLSLLAGCNGDTRSGPKRRTFAAVSSQTVTGGGSAVSPTTGAPAPRLQPGDKGVQVGLRLLRAEVSPSDAAAAWTAEGVTPEQARDLLGRLPLTPAFGPGRHQAVIADGFGRSTDITVIVPQKAPPPAGYPVLLCLHGLGGDSGHVAGVATLAPEAIVVGPTALKPPASVPFEDDAPVPLLNAFPHWWVYRDHGFALRALDWVRERYPVDSDRVLLNGVSMGGFGAWNVGLRLHDRFAGLGAGAGGISRKEFGVGRDATTRKLLENAAMLPTWFAHGDADQVVPVTFSRWIDEDLKALGIAHTYKEVAGAGHDSAAFTPLYSELRAWGEARRRDPSPARVRHRAIAADHLGAYWLELRAPGAAEASVSGNTITVSGAPATVFLDPRLVDVSRPVTVQGTVSHQGLVAPSLIAVARSFARTRDPRLTYAHMVGN